MFDLSFGVSFLPTARVLLEFDNAISSDDFSVKVYDVTGRSQSIRLDSGSSFSVDLSVIESAIAEDVESINLMYRKDDAPHIVQLIQTTFDNMPDNYLENELPVPLHSNDAIVTAL